MDKGGMTLDEFLAEWSNDDDCVLVHTSGSTGKPKPLRVEKKRMLASARTTCCFLGLDSSDVALLCMPLDYIAGKMVVVRSLACGMRLISVAPSSHPLSQLAEVPTFAAMVPMQVYCSMQDESERQKLMGIKNLIIGGGAIDPSLEEQLRSFPNNVWSTYGMTETLSHIALRRINDTDDSKASEYYTPFDGVDVSSLPDGRLRIYAPEICPEPLETNDIVEFDSTGRNFKVLGRADNVIDTGGIKVQIEEVEKLLHDVVPYDFAITRVADRKYGEAVAIAVAVPSDKGKEWLQKELDRLKEQVDESLHNKYYRPRYYFPVGHIPHTGTGKIARAEVEKLIDICHIH